MRNTQAARRPYGTPTALGFGQRAQSIVLYHGERIAAEVPRTLRRLGTLFLVLSISIPVFLATLAVLLWYAAR